MLLNWDGNELYLNPITAGLYGGIDMSAAKNLVLELTYSVAHHVQALIQELCYRTIRSMNRADKHHNPTAICCALWIIFTATHKFEKRNFTATSLTNLVSGFSILSTNVFITPGFAILTNEMFREISSASFMSDREPHSSPSISTSGWPVPVAAAMRRTTKATLPS
jgi:hypothetical protein